MRERIGEGQSPSHLCRPLTKGRLGQPLGASTLRNQNLLGLKARLNHLSRSSAVLACVTQISVEAAACSFTPSSLQLPRAQGGAMGRARC